MGPSPIFLDSRGIIWRFRAYPTVRTDDTQCIAKRRNPMPEHHIFLSLKDDSPAYRVPLSQVQEIINLEGPFGDLDTNGPTVGVRNRTVHIVRMASPSPTDRLPVRKLVLFEQNHRLMGLPVHDADLTEVAGYRELSLSDLRAS